MSAPFLDRLRSRASAHLRSIAFPEGEDPRVLDAAVLLHEKGLAHPILFGSAPTLRDGLTRRGIGAGVVDVVDTDDPGHATWAVERLVEAREDARTRPSGGGPRGMTLERAEAFANDPLALAALWAGAGRADGMVAGCTRPTADVLRAALRCVGLAPGRTTLSSSFYMVAEAEGRGGFPEVLTFSDAGVVPEPTPEQLCEIALEAARARPLIVGDEPQVAFLSYSTHGSAAGPSVTRVQEGLAQFRAAAPLVVADGELQGDAALVADVRTSKAPESPLEGAANVLIFPSLDAGNLAYKLVQRLGGRVALGPVLQGLAVPCNDLSRGATAEDIVLVACITSLMAGS